MDAAEASPSSSPPSAFSMVLSPKMFDRFVGNIKMSEMRRNCLGTSPPLYFVYPLSLCYFSAKERMVCYIYTYRYIDRL